MKNSKSPLKLLESKLKRKKIEVPEHDDPRTELKRLVKLHSTFTRNSTALKNMASDRELKTGEIIHCLLPEDGLGGKDKLLATASEQKRAAKQLESAMERELRKLPVYRLFLEKVYGVGPILSSYLCAYVDIRRAEKPSQLQRYCGLAVIDGHFEKRSGGPKFDANGNKTGSSGTFNQEIRTMIWLAFASMYKTSGGDTLKKRSKYLDAWRNTKSRELLRATSGKIESNGKELSAKGYANSKGWHVAAQLFVYDLYIVWRSVEGLPSWTTWYDWARGYEHGRGPLPRENAPRMLTVEEALQIIGHVGKTSDYEKAAE
jgi:hypothetical protein